MEIKKVFNNNVVLTQNEAGQEMVVMGRGLAFQKKAGETIESSKIEKTFVLDNHGVSDKIGELLREVPEEYLTIADRIISMAKKSLGSGMDDYVYVALMDHISFAVTRHKQGMVLRNALIWEIKKYYKEEFQIGLKALDIIEEEAGIRMEEDEAASIALHLVNSRVSGEGLDSAVQIVKVVNDTLNIVKYHYKMEIDETSINYERFLTHLRFFAIRLVRREKTDSVPGDDFMFTQVQSRYPDAFACSEKVASYVEKTFNWPISTDEKVYLTVHIHRVTSRQELNRQG
ncbi:BglG family transcription antiterminator LicT [Domibacillus enclensis]|uniref:Transcription antiterminator BglG n=1 Tax=Domibacillus enclensis TaxID=1017273 RepID=A0A1N6ZHT1_9BACI|nr:PRD domain-containing protein [Domibacillus enclensis]OXS76709.1 transcription antiterminator BglG [Domibacillus enclensis]SIR26393.1 transcriptional antiterminator, BglG family [Domibacillus enclensis]